jgi:hypothetical protein
MLVDFGSTHKCIDINFAKKLNLFVYPTKDIIVKIVDVKSYSEISWHAIQCGPLHFPCGISVKIPGPINLPSWSVFDQATALSFHCLVLVFYCFITANSP